MAWKWGDIQNNYILEIISLKICSPLAPTINPFRTSNCPWTSIGWFKSSPLLKKRSVGIDVTLKRSPSLLFLSKSSFSNFINPSSFNFSRIGLKNLQGPHHCCLCEEFTQISVYTSTMTLPSFMVSGISSPNSFSSSILVILISNLWFLLF